MGFQDREIETLVQLGLTQLQAEVYLTLAKQRKASIKEIASLAEIDRAHVYQVVNRLFEIGLVRKELGKPNLFEAIFLREGLEILLENKTKQWNNIKNQTRQIIEKNGRNEIAKNSAETNFDFTINPGRLTGKEYFKHESTARKSIDGIFAFEEDYCRAALEQSTWASLGKKGVRVRLIVGRSDKSSLPRIKVSQILRRSYVGNLFTVRSAPCRPAATFAIFDESLVSFALGSVFKSKQDPTLASNNDQIIALAKGYFEQLWQTSEQLVYEKNIVS